MKPDWKDAPEWAQYLAMDSDGEWYWFEFRPGEKRECWLGVGRTSMAGRSLSWLDSLESRP